MKYSILRNSVYQSIMCRQLNGLILKSLKLKRPGPKSEEKLTGPGPELKNPARADLYCDIKELGSVLPQDE